MHSNMIKWLFPPFIEHMFLWLKNFPIHFASNVSKSEAVRRSYQWKEEIPLSSRNEKKAFQRNCILRWPRRHPFQAHVTNRVKEVTLLVLRNYAGIWYHICWDRITNNIRNNILIIWSRYQHCVRDDGDDNTHINVYVFQPSHAYYALYENTQCINASIHTWAVPPQSNPSRIHAKNCDVRFSDSSHSRAFHKHFINISPSKYVICFVSVGLIQLPRLKSETCYTYAVRAIQCTCINSIQMVNSYCQTHQVNIHQHHIHSTLNIDSVNKVSFWAIVVCQLHITHTHIHRVHRVYIYMVNGESRTWFSAYWNCCVRICVLSTSSLFEVQFLFHWNGETTVKWETKKT